MLGIDNGWPGKLVRLFLADWWIGEIENGNWKFGKSKLENRISPTGAWRRPGVLAKFRVSSFEFRFRETKPFEANELNAIVVNEIG